jgi:RND family efflux transporter MFP subunit
MFKRIAIIVIVVALLAGGGFYAYQRLTAAKTSATANLQTGTVARGNLTAVVSAGGSLASPQTGSVTWGIAGTVGTVHVKVGDKVKANQVLMELNPNQLDTSLVQAQANLLTDQAALNTLLAGATQQQIATGQLAVVQDMQVVTNAQAVLITATTGATQQQIASANVAVLQDSQAVTTAQNSLRNALNPVSQSLQDSINTAKLALDTASANAQLATVSQSVQDYTNAYWLTDFFWKRYQNLQATYTASPTPENLVTVNNAYNDWKVLDDKQSARQLTFQTDQANKNDAVSTAQKTYNQAVAILNNAKAGPVAATVALDRQTLTLAQATLAQAQTNLATLKAGADPAAVALAQQQLNLAQATQAQAQTDLATLKAGPTDAALAAAKAKIAVDQAELAKVQIVAPFEATVVAVDTGSGALVNASTVAVELADLRSLQVQIAVSEVDINQVKTGQAVNLTLDALSGQSFTGQVNAIGYLGTSSQGVVNYPVTVVITNPDPALKPGMTASAAIVTDEHDNVLLVPNRAIHATGNQRSVTVLFEGTLIPVTVQVGLSGDTQSEITGGQLKEGDTIVLNSTTTTTTGGFGGGGGGGILRGGPGG